MRNHQALAGDHGYILHSWKQHFQTADSLGVCSSHLHTTPWGRISKENSGLGCSPVGVKAQKGGSDYAEAKSHFWDSEAIAYVELKSPEF